MLEKYEKDFDENEFVRSFMERKQISTKKQALAELRRNDTRTPSWSRFLREHTARQASRTSCS